MLILDGRNLFSFQTDMKRKTVDFCRVCHGREIEVTDRQTESRRQ